MSEIAMTNERAEMYRIAASELLTESNTRGDQDEQTIAWVVGFLLRRANSEPVKFAPGGRVDAPPNPTLLASIPCTHCGGSGSVQGFHVGQPVECSVCGGRG